MITCEDIVSQIDALPPLPDTALKIMDVLNDPRNTVEQLVEVIRYDQAVTTEVLRLCNSAYLGAGRRIDSLADAMVCLGTAKVTQLVMSVHTNSLFTSEQDGYGLQPGALWRHSVGVALAAASVASLIKMPNKGVVFTAGLLHDIGKIVLNEFVREGFAEIVRLVTDKQQSFLEAEQAVLGFSHQEIGAAIGEKWRLPEPIVDCIRHHHDPTSIDPPSQLVDVIYIADTTAMLFGVGLGLDGLAYRADEAVVARLGLNQHDMQNVGAQMLVELKRAEQLFESVG